jgi:uncharacterized membrane protein
VSALLLNSDEHQGESLIHTASPTRSTPTSTALAASAPSRSTRLVSIDVVRGIVMVLMAIDHVRVYSGIPAGGPTAGVFFTRWVTHFCAPAFVFLAGTSAFFHGRKLGGKGALARYLATRGFMLVVLELTLIRFAWTFSLDYSQFVLAGVIWMLGWCMILMAVLVRFSAKTVGITGLVVIFAQDLVGMILRALPHDTPIASLWPFIYLGGEVQVNDSPTVSVLYVIVPWIGVMAAGYGFGAILMRNREDRRRWCHRIGLSATAAFVVIAVLLVTLNAAPKDAPPALFRVLNQRKYPASQLFLLMTLGPTIALLPLVEDARGAIGKALATFGRVPMFFYLAHIPLIHASALVANLVLHGSAHGAAYLRAPYVQMPPNDRWSLPLLYLVWAIDVALLYFACRWYSGVKARRREAWLGYL